MTNMNFREKLFHYEAPPPPDAWEGISRRLGATRRSFRLYWYAGAAAASVLIIAGGFLLLGKSSGGAGSVARVQGASLPGRVRDSINANNRILRHIITTSADKDLLALNYEYASRGRKYLTVAGPDGKPVKISPKAATLIESADNEFPPRPVWNKKVDKWQQIMLSSTLSPTSTGLLRIIQPSLPNESE